MDTDVIAPQQVELTSQEVNQTKDVEMKSDKPEFAPLKASELIVIIFIKIWLYNYLFFLKKKLNLLFSID